MKSGTGRRFVCGAIAAIIGGAFAACSSSPSPVDPPDDHAVPQDTKPEIDTALPDRATPPDTGVDAADSAITDASDASVIDAGPDTSPPIDSGPPPEALWASVTLPPFDQATVAHVREVRQRGQSKNGPNVVGKLGDSITASTHFFYDVGNGSFDLGNYGALAGTIAAVRGVTLSDGKNPFNHKSAAAVGGWNSGQVLAGSPNALTTEVGAIRPAYAIVMFGTNDGNATGPFTTNMNEIVRQLEAEDVVTVISTIPDRKDYTGSGDAVRAINVEVRKIAAERHLPLIDLFAGLAPLPNAGLDPADNLHPSYQASGTSGNFSDQGLQYGYNFRNLTAIQMLDRLRKLP